jgi:fumarate reductase subunit C
MLREFSAVFLATYTVVLLLLAMRVHDGRHAFKGYLQALQSPPFLAFTVVALLFAILHTVTWFQAVPKALPVRRGEDKVPPLLLIGANYVVMMGLTAIVLAVFLA